MKELSRCLLVLGVCLSFCYAVPSSFQNMKSGKSYENFSMVQVSDSPLHILTADACLLSDSSLQFILQGYLHSPTNDMKNFTQVFPDHEGNLFYYHPSTMTIKPLYITLKQLLSQKYVAVPELPNLLIQARRRNASNQFQSFQQNLVWEDTLNIEDELDISIVRESDLYVIWQFKVLNISSKYDRDQTSSTDDYIPKYEKMEEIAKLYSMDTLYLEFTAVFILALVCGICIGKKYSCSRSKALVKPIIVSLGANEYLISSETKSNQGDSVSKLPIKIEDTLFVTKNDYILFNFMDASNSQTSNIERKSTTDSEQKSCEDVSPNAFPHHPISITTSSPSQQVKYEVNPMIQEFDINSSESESNSEYEQDLAEEPESDDEYSEYDQKQASDSDSASAVSFNISNLDLKGLHLQETNEDLIQFQKSDSADISRSDGDLSSLPNKRISSSFIYIEADKPEISLKRSFGGEYMAKMTETKPNANIEIFIRSNLEVKYNGERKDSTDDSDCKEDIDKLTYFLENGRLNKTFDKLSFLGKGGFGRVYKAKHKLDEQIYAVKVVPFNYGVRKSVKQHKLFREVISMSKLNSKYLLRYYNCWLESSNNLKQTPEVENSSDEERSVDESIDSSLSVGEPYIPLLLHIQTEYSPGKTLKQWLENKYRVVDRYENLIIFKQLAKGLLHIHKNNLIHRDLKPANIFIETDNRMIKVKIGDFGLAILHNYESDSILPNIEFGNGRIPRSHSLNVGTPLYFPPEQKKNPNYNHKVDIYPLGLILLELSTNLVTTHEKIATFTELRVSNRLADDFEERFPIESRLIKWLVCEDPNLRPDSLEILESIPVMKWEKEMNESSPWSGRYIPSSPVIL